MARSCNVHEGLHMNGMRKSDYLEPDAVHKSELSNVSYAGVRDVHRGEQFATVQGWAWASSTEKSRGT